MPGYEINIKIDDELVKKEKEHNLALEQEKARQKQEQAIAKANKKAVATIKEIGLMAVRELVVSKVGEVARDSLLQRQIDVGAGIITTIGAFAIHPMLGAISVATSTISQSIEYNISANKEASRLAIMGERAGNINRSR